jgi:D-alanyl-D-alanine dipeptidase
MLNTYAALAEQAPKPWQSPAVPADVARNVFYESIGDIQGVEIRENGDPLIDLAQLDHLRIQDFFVVAARTPQYQKCAQNYVRYPGSTRIRKGFYEKLLKALEHLPSHIGIVYAEGFRPLEIQKKYFDDKFKEIMGAKVFQEKLAAAADEKTQCLILEEIYKETCKSVSPFIENAPTHGTGAALDLSLFDRRTGQLLDMGEFDCIWGPNPQQETFSPNTTPLQRTNRLMLLKALAVAGIVNYGYEWWHVSFGDKVWAKVMKQPHALYGLPPELADHPILKINRKAYCLEMLRFFKKGATE